MPEKSVEELQRAKEAAAGAKRQAAMAATLTGVATELGKVTGGSLTVPAEVFRQRELSSAALAAAAQKVAGTITSATSTMPVLVTSRTDQAQSALAARSFFAAIDGLRAAATDLIGRTTRLLAQAEVDAEEPKAAEKPPAVPSDPIAAAAALAVAALNLLTVETTVTAATGTATELETHVPVIHQLLATQVPVLHSSIGIPPAGNRVLDAFAELASLRVRLDAIAAAATEEIARSARTHRPTSSSRSPSARRRRRR